MRVRIGWSGEVETNKWAKIDVQMEEVDLERILASNNIAIDTSSLPTSLAYLLLEAEAEGNVLAKLVDQYGYPAPQAEFRRQKLKATKDNILQALRNRVTRA